MPIFTPDDQNPPTVKTHVTVTTITPRRPATMPYIRSIKAACVLLVRELLPQGYLSEKPTSPSEWSAVLVGRTDLVCNKARAVIIRFAAAYFVARRL